MEITMEFTVLYEACHDSYISKVYALDRVHGQFLIADKFGFFHWVDIDECRLIDGGD